MDTKKTISFILFAVVVLLILFLILWKKLFDKSFDAELREGTIEDYMRDYCSTREEAEKAYKSTVNLLRILVTAHIAVITTLLSIVIYLIILDR